MLPDTPERLSAFKVTSFYGFLNPSFIKNFMFSFKILSLHSLNQKNE